MFGLVIGEEEFVELTPIFSLYMLMMNTLLSPLRKVLYVCLRFM